MAGAGAEVVRAPRRRVSAGPSSSPGVVPSGTRDPRPVFDLEAEQCVLGAWFVDPDQTRQTIGETFDFEPFHLLGHQEIAKVIATRFRKGEAIDPFLIRGELIDDGKHEAADLVLPLAKGLGTASNVGYYWQRVLDLAERRAAGEPDELVLLSPGSFAVTPGADGLPASLLPAGRLLDTPFPPVTFAIKPYFPRNEITELAGAHGIFKSTAALAACLSVATGQPWGGAPVEQGRAVFVTMEDGERTLSWRVRAWLESIPAGQERGDAEADVRANFAYLAREQAQELALTSTDRNTTVARGVVVERLAALVKGAVLVVLETASRLHDGPEMNEALAVFARAVEQVAMESGAAVVIVRHVSKAAAREQVVDSYAGRGGGALSDAARSVLVMTLDRKPDDQDDGEVDPFTPVRLTHAKSTHAPKGPRIVWKPVAVEHGVYLQHLSQDAEAREGAGPLLAHLLEIGEGITKSDLHKNKTTAGLGRTAAQAAIKHLLDSGRVVQTVEDRARNKGVVVYRAVRSAS